MLAKRIVTTSLIATTTCLLVLLFLCSGIANASLSEFKFVGSFAAGESTEGIAVDESTGDVYAYVYDGNRTAIKKFDAEGDPVDFSALASSEITGLGPFHSGEAQLAVDNSSGPAKGDIYFAGGVPGMQIFGPDGNPLAN